MGDDRSESKKFLSCVLPDRYVREAGDPYLSTGKKGLDPPHRSSQTTVHRQSEPDQRQFFPEDQRTSISWKG